MPSENMFFVLGDLWCLGDGPAFVARTSTLGHLKTHLKPVHQNGGQITTAQISSPKLNFVVHSQRGVARRNASASSELHTAVYSRTKAVPAKDIYHQHVLKALIKDGWTITHDPLRLQWGPKDMYVDLGAEQMFAAEKQGRKIAVEIKSFVGASEIEDLKNALGQFVLYRAVMKNIEPERLLYLAIRHATFLELFNEPVGKLLIESEHLNIVVFDPAAEEILQWIH